MWIKMDDAPQVFPIVQKLSKQMYTGAAISNPISCFSAVESSVVCAVVIVEWSRGAEVPLIHTLHQSRVRSLSSQSQRFTLMNKSAPKGEAKSSGSLPGG